MTKETVELMDKLISDGLLDGFKVLPSIGYEEDAQDFTRVYAEKNNVKGLYLNIWIFKRRFRHIDNDRRRYYITYTRSKDRLEYENVIYSGYEDTYVIGFNDIRQLKKFLKGFPESLAFELL